MNSTCLLGYIPKTFTNPTSTLLALVLTCLAQPTQQAYKATLALGQSMITYFNYGKPGHKSNACTEPCKQGTIQEIDKQEQELDIIDKDLGKEDP